MKLMIAVPSVDYMHFKFVECLTKLMHRLDEIEDLSYDVEIKGGSLVYLARDELTEKAISGNYDKVLWLDADMVFDSDIYDKLSEIKADMVTGMYVSRHNDNMSCVFSSLIPAIRIGKVEGEEPIDIMACGFGGVLIKADVLERVFREFGSCFRPDQGFGEDLTFCKRVNKLGGYSMKLHPGVKLGHIGQSVIMPDKSVNFI